MGIFDFFKKTEEKKESKATDQLDVSLEKTRVSLFSRLSKALIGKSRIDESFLDELEEILITSDVGIDTTLRIIERVEKRVARDKYLNARELDVILKDEIQQLLSDHKTQPVYGFDIPKTEDPYVIMVVGVNGVGKTTTIGKIANQFKLKGKKVIIGAADTFRAAAIDQIGIWAERAGADIVHREMGSDPASVAFDTVQSAKAKGYDVVILDTAGRLHNKLNLMNELSKVSRVVKKVIPDGPHETVLILDASTGQNAIEQARQFIKATEVDTLAITKLDGTAKGGVVLGIVDQFKIPVKYIGVGEKINDLQIFDAGKFVESLFNTEISEE